MWLTVKKWLLLVAAFGMAGALAGCGSASASSMQTVRVEIQGMAFSTQEIVLKQGRPARLVLVNNDTEVHDLSIDEIPVIGLIAGPAEHDHDMSGIDPDLHVSAKPGESGAVMFTPTTRGRYVFYCAATGHKAAGMQGTLVVR